MSKEAFRECISDTLISTSNLELDVDQEAEIIAGCYNVFKLEEEAIFQLAIGQDFLDGMTPTEILAAGAVSTLTFQFIDPATGVPTIGPSVGSVLYEASPTPAIAGTFAPLGSSHDATNNFPLAFTVTSAEEDIVAIPFDLSGAPIVITGVDGFNVAEGDVDCNWKGGRGRLAVTTGSPSSFSGLPLLWSQPHALFVPGSCSMTRKHILSAASAQSCFCRRRPAIC
jgi:hypothetical protein